MDIEKDSNREAFEAIPRNARVLRGAKFKDGEYVALSLFDESSKELAAQLNYGWVVWQAAKAQAVPKVIDVGNELQSWVAVNSFSADDGDGVLPVVDANAIAEKIEELTGANA